MNKDEETIVYYTPPYHVAENNVARKIVELSRVELDILNIDINKAISEIEGEEGIIFAKKNKGKP